MDGFTLVSGIFAIAIIGFVLALVLTVIYELFFKPRL
jgi:hypothetical protein